MIHMNTHTMENFAAHKIDVKLLQKALSIPSGGSRSDSYYSLVINGKRIQGERPWEDRWHLIKSAMDFSGKRVLELGCSIGICSMYLLKFAHAASAVGVELPSNSNAIKAAYLLKAAFFVDNFSVKPLSLDGKDYEEILGYNYDVVVCMSILKWVRDKERLLRYIASFDHVIFEGHDADEIEIKRFMDIGFKNYKILGSTHIGYSYPLDRHRTLIYFSK